MTDSGQTALRITPLDAIHESLGASFTGFAGWRMPVRYDSDLAEHRAVRERAGLFDLSHMGEIHVRGPQAGEALDHALAGRLSAISVGRAKYTLMLTAQGTVVDDLIVYRLAQDHYLVVANAANAAVDLQELITRTEGFAAEVDDRTEQTALIAVQGPLSERIVADVLGEDLSQLRYYRWMPARFAGQELLLARTGYTGEDGFELYVEAEQAPALWEALAAAGGEDLTPCGLACRDTLRLEAGMPLYGQELSRDLLPVQAGLGGVVALRTKGDFVGREGIEARAETADSLPRLVGLAAEGRRAARTGAEVRTVEGESIGAVTSGALSPTLGHPIAMAIIDPALADPGTALVVDVRGRDLPVQVVPLPFYTR